MSQKTFSLIDNIWYICYYNGIDANKRWEYVYHDLGDRELLYGG